MSKPSIGIIGVGYVGGALHHWFSSVNKHPLFLYDKYKGLGSPEEVNRADIIFIATPTPFHEEEEERYDDSAVRDALANVYDGKTVIIKSSVIPGSTERFQKEHPRKMLFFNPEFLTAKNALHEFLNGERQIMGYADEAYKEKAKEILQVLPDAPYKKVMRAAEAEMVKFFGNTYLATRVIFANHIYDLCEKLGIDYDSVREGVSHDTRIGGSHLNVLQDGYRGYGGTNLPNSACFPKDMKAFIQFADALGVDLPLHKKAEEVNEKLKRMTP